MASVPSSAALPVTCSRSAPAVPPSSMSRKPAADCAKLPLMVSVPGD
jgi:hypothetical protein